MKRRLMAVLMACVMTLSLLPISALATENSGMEFHKTASVNEDGKTYTISMEAWATGKTTTQEKPQPLDIALVLDVSGSMDDPFTGDQKKIDALKTAVNGFIEGVAAKSPDSNISIVKFAGKMTDKVGNDMYRDGYLYNYTQIVKGLTPVGTEKDALKAAVSSLKPAGATPADYGMQLAQAALAPSTSGNSKVVVMFTDGEPNHYSDFDNSVAARAVNTAKNMKDGGTTIYTVGVFTKLSEKVIDYMNATSSNYPQATATDNFDVTWGEGSDKGYYKTASNAADLNNIFTTISQDISSAAKPELNASTTVVDTLSEYFTFADTNPVSSVKVYTADWNGNSWNEKVEAPANVTAGVEGKTVRVTGYNYAANYVHGTEGQKLIIEITVVASGIGCVSSEIPTNADGDMPAAQVVLNQTVVTSAPGKTITGHAVIYDLDGGQSPSNFPKLYYPAGAVVPVTSNVPTKDNHKFTGWMRDNAIVAANTSLEILNDDITLVAQWELSTHSVTGTIDKNGTVTNDNQTVNHGGACENMVFTPNPGYKIASVTVNNVPETNFVIGEDGTYTYSNPQVTEDIRVVVTTEIDDSQTKDLSYTVEYYKDGEKVDTDTQTETKTVQVLEPNTLTVDKSKINTTDKYYGYKLEKTEPAPIPESIEDKGTIKVYYVKDEGKTKDLSYTVEYYKDGVKVDADTQTETKTVQVLEPNTLTVNKSKINTTDKYYGYKLEKTEPAPIPESIEDKGTIKVYYVKDEGKTKDLSYTVEYYKDGVKVDADTQTETKTVQVLEPNTLTVNKSKINTTDKYYGYKLEKTEPTPIPESIKDKGVIKVYYVKDDGQTKDLSYTVEYYKDGVKVDADTQTETKTVQVLEPNTLTVDKSKINTTDKYYGYKLEKTEPTPIPESIENEGVIKVYYVKDDSQTQPTKYTVRYTIEGVEQENDKIEVEGSAWVNDEPAMIAIAEGGIPTPSNKYNGYKPDPANPEYPAAGTPVESGSEYTVNYVKRTDLSYTVHYYLKDTTTKLADDKVVIDQTFGAAVTEKALDIAGYNVFGESEKTITIGVGANEIIFYYTRVVYPYVPVVKPALNRDDHYAYVVGYPDGMVRPSGNITRAEAATIFFRLLTDDSRNQFWMTTNAYSDVNRGDWFNNAVSTLSNAGIISGYPDGTFRPNAPITRAEMSKIIALFAKLNKSEDRFNDIAGHWAEAYIKLAAGNGWIAGYPDGSFKPQQNITRAETMTMINRVLERVPSVESHLLPYNAMLTFPDCQSGQWFYIAVQEATNSHTYERAASEKNGDEQWIALRANRDWTQFQN